MAKNDKPSPGRPKNPRKSVPIQIRMPEDVVNLLDVLMRRNERTRNQEIMRAVRKHLREEGLLPDAAPTNEGDE